LPLHADRWDEARAAMVQRLLHAGYLQPGRVAEALREVPRHVFLPGHEDAAYDDRPQPIGAGQTISAPHMVATMAEALHLEPGMKVLEVGSGSGYHAAVVAELVAPHGKVVSVERFEDLAAQARANLLHAGYDHEQVEVVVGDGSEGWAPEAPYDRAYLTCAAPAVPQPVLEQVREGGILLAPIGERQGQELLRITRTPEGDEEDDLGGCVFVPLVGQHGFAESTWN
jgi:protein-L-isoaspartate(D-aspartate) O-methyltransferase